MIAAILHNKRREKEARLHIMARIHAIMKKMDIPIEDVSPNLLAPLPFHHSKNKKDPPMRIEYYASRA
ncbi:unnamed protein product [Linum trigynum]|uniref:Uncharacterized protein n=1 Tax=Linum trigynum TaxID=586398 RepID=A0AAV2EB44_9ROSI